MSGLRFVYGDYQHPVGEVYPQVIEVTPVYSEEGVRWASDVRYQIGGSFCRDPVDGLDPTDINAMIFALDSAYRDDYRDFGFLLPDGTRTSHFLENNDQFNISGNKILSRSWQYQSPAEFANTRSFTISLGARFVDSYSSILYFSERLSIKGNGGARWEYNERWLGEPVREEISERTPVEIIQRGVLVGTTSLVAAPAPWFPESEHGPDRFIERVSPRLHGHDSFDRATHYGVTYSYRFLMPTVPDTRPNFWIPN